MNELTRMIHFLPAGRLATRMRVSNGRCRIRTTIRHRMNPTSLSRTAQCAHRNSLQIHLDEAAFEVVGKVKVCHRSRRVHLYGRRQMSTEMNGRYFDADRPGLRHRLTRAADPKQTTQAGKRRMSRLMRLSEPKE